MYKNYFLLSRLAIELNEILPEAILNEAFTQNKNQIIFDLTKNDKKLFIEISTDPANPYINVRDAFTKSRKNTTNFFSNMLPAKITSVDFSEVDRILRFSCESGNFYFLVRGYITNVCSLDRNKNIYFFKKTEEAIREQTKKELLEQPFSNKRNLMPELVLPENISGEIVKQQNPIIRKVILQELEFRGLQLSVENIRKLIAEIYSGSPTVLIDENENSIHLSIDSFHSFSFTEKKQFDCVTDAMNIYIANKHALEGTTIIKKNILKYLEREMSRLSKKINNLLDFVNRGSKDVYYSKLANLLLINLNDVKPGDEEITVEDVFDQNNQIKIKLDTKLSPQQNAEKYFDQAKNDKIRFEKTTELVKNYKKDYGKFHLYRIKLAETDSLEILKTIKKELGIKEYELNTNVEDDLKNKFKHYVIQNKYHVYVGKDSKNNDLLTTRFAKQNDYWFHARSVPGSHIVLKIENSKEAVPNNILKSAASIAAFHSKAKTSGLAPVTFTLKKYVVKKKGFPLGTVHLLKEDVLLVKPEIPADTEYIYYE